MINGKKIFDQTINNNLKTFDNIWQILVGKGDDYISGCLLDYPYFEKYYRLFEIDISNKN